MQLKLTEREVLVLPMDGNRDTAVVVTHDGEDGLYRVHRGALAWSAYGEGRDELDPLVYVSEHAAFTTAFSIAGWNVWAAVRHHS